MQGYQLEITALGEVPKTGSLERVMSRRMYAGFIPSQQVRLVELRRTGDIAGWLVSDIGHSSPLRLEQLEISNHDQMAMCSMLWVSITGRDIPTTFFFRLLNIFADSLQGAFQF